MEIRASRGRLEFLISRGFNHGHLLRSLTDLLPQVFAAGSGLGRVRKQVGGRIFVSQRSQDIVELIVGETVALGADQQKVAPAGGQEVQELAIVLLRRNVHIDQSNAEGESWALMEVRLYKLWPLLRNFARNFGVTVAREIGEDQLGTRFSGPANFKEVDAAGASRSGTGAGQLGADQGIDDAGFTDVGTAEERDFGKAGSGEVGDIGGRCQETRQDSHIQVCNAVREIGKAWTSPNGVFGAWRIPTRQRIE